MLPTYLLAAWFAVPLLAWGAMLCVRRRVHFAWVGALCFLAMIGGTFILANYVWALDAQLLAEVDKYEPGTPESERASEEWASDTDRSFLLLLSPVLTAIWYGFLFLLLFGLQWVARRRFPAQHTSVIANTDNQTAEQRSDDGNPCQSPTVGSPGTTPTDPAAEG